MPKYRRVRTMGGTYFFTVVTYRRRKIFTDEAVINELRQVIKTVRQMHPFTIDAWVLLPDHMHCVWTLPQGDEDYSKRMGMIKARFTWQRRFWEHGIRDEKDFEWHVDYVHYNPVKHGLVKRVCDWPYSTFHRYVKEEVYSRNWSGVVEDAPGTFGE